MIPGLVTVPLEPPPQPRRRTAATWHCATCAVSWAGADPCWVCGTTTISPGPARLYQPDGEDT